MYVHSFEIKIVDDNQAELNEVLVAEILTCKKDKKKQYMVPYQPDKVIDRVYIVIQDDDRPKFVHEEGEWQSRNYIFGKVIQEHRLGDTRIIRSELEQCKHTIQIVLVDFIFIVHRFHITKLICLLGPHRFLRSSHCLTRSFTRFLF